MRDVIYLESASDFNGTQDVVAQDSSEKEGTAMPSYHFVVTGSEVVEMKVPANVNIPGCGLLKLKTILLFRLYEVLQARNLCGVLHAPPSLVKGTSCTLEI